MLNKILSRFVQWGISRVDNCCVDDVLSAAIKRKQKDVPDWDIVYLALPKDPKQRGAYWKQAQQLDECTREST